ncbi:hypothetical protein AWB79_06489 [Caballeronia hypogeia]|uniref:Glycosyltransferase RgtA/B/C/D-like domain-containing protein n=1 Tax=Caballeronia hypogeia TaxID=1777140 RepID=A0A158D5E3_9BURK|nr:hypothetical protein [Caballeronia hypogeia]SAK89904.1 hypothetical protein AWB79_06489 [Caballeronia hypogeia]
MNSPSERADTAASPASASLSRSGFLFDWLPRALFIVTLLYGAALFWIAPRPPLVDLPQHAAQVMLLRDLLEHASPWQSLVRINLFTPYLIGYGLALPLTYVMSISAALKFMLMLAYFGFVAAGVGFRRHLNGDARLDVLFIPGFFGFAFAWGFYTFLVAAPFGMLFMWLTHRFATQPSLARGTGVVLAGTALFFCHGLVFLFACAIGTGFALVKPRRFVDKIRALAPFVPLGLLCIVYTWWSHASDPVLGKTIENVASVDWGWKDMGWKRLLAFPTMVWGLTKWSALYLPLVALMGAAPWIWRDRINPDRAVLVPMLAVVVIWLFVPNMALGTAYLFQRFALFLLPAYALMFVSSKSSVAQAPQTGHVSARRLRDLGLQFAIIAGCWIFLANQSIRLHRFAAEIAPLEQMLSRTEPNQRAISLIFDAASEAYWSPDAYLQQALWYQAEKHGFVDPNFAQYLPQIVRFRPDELPVAASTLDRFPGAFDWKKNNGRMYRYFFVRKSDPLPANFFANDECDVSLLMRSGEWSLYERRNCR